MKELQPSLKSLVKDIDEITDFSDMKAAKVGGLAIKKVLDAETKTSDLEDKIVEPKVSDKTEKKVKKAAVRAISKISEKAAQEENPVKAKVMLEAAKTAAVEASKSVLAE